MQRPLMNPSLLLELDAPKRRLSRLALFKRMLGCTWNVLLFEPLGFLRRRQRVEIGSPFNRVCRAVLYRLMALPFVIAAVAGVMVFNGTHPPVIQQTQDPQSLGIYHDPVTFMAEDGTRLEGWLAPVVDARRVIEQGEEAIRKRRAAVVLVHDYGATREQMLPLVRPLHEEGFVVLVVGLRGSDSKVPAGQTFGLNESGDVRAAVELLRRRPSVDARRIAIVGTGTGATAALLAARSDAGVAALVLDNPLRHSDDLMHRISPGQWWLAWMRPMCKWAFDLTYGVHAEDVDLRGFRAVMETRPCLMLDNGTAGAAGLKRHTVEQIAGFLRSHLSLPAEAVVTTDLTP